MSNDTLVEFINNRTTYCHLFSIFISDNTQVTLVIRGVSYPENGNVYRKCVRRERNKCPCIFWAIHHERPEFVVPGIKMMVESVKLLAQLCEPARQLVPRPRIWYWCFSWYWNKNEGGESKCNEGYLYIFTGRSVGSHGKVRKFWSDHKIWTTASSCESDNEHLYC
jgi:hypothetical protein